VWYRQDIEQRLKYVKNTCGTKRSIKICVNRRGTYLYCGCGIIAYKYRQLTVDRPDSCIAKTCSLVLLTSIYVVVLDCIPVYQFSKNVWNMTIQNYSNLKHILTYSLLSPS
jgi:hypothetical protein